jgi:hypothetical protein
MIYGIRNCYDAFVLNVDERELQYKDLRRVASDDNRMVFGSVLID